MEPEHFGLSDEYIHTQKGLDEYLLYLETQLVKLNNQLCNLKAAPAELQTQINLLIEMHRMLEIRVRNLEVKNNAK